MQVATICIFGLGAVIGMIGLDGRVLLAYGYYEVKQPIIATLAMALLSGAMIFTTWLVQPIKVRVLNLPRSRMLALSVAWLYIGAALALMTYNWTRLDAWNLVFTEPGAIAFRLTDEHGVVTLYTTMLCFFVGATFLLDNSDNLAVKLVLAASATVFALGLLGLTRREMLILFVAWWFVHIAITGGRRRSVLLWSVGILFGVGLYLSMLLRSIDILDDPMSYFLSGEFEPFRFSLYLLEQWIRKPEIVSPWSYMFPLVDDHSLIGSVNCYFNYVLNGEEQCLGRNTVTIYTTMLYFGLLPPLFFYAVAIFLVKQTAFWVERQPSYLHSFLYAFCLLRLFLLIRNGELLNGLIDNVVLLILVVLFYSVVGCKITRDSSHPT